MQYPVLVQFSGSTKEYGYLLTQEQAALVHKGARVVVPTKMKDDGSVSLSIATVTDLEVSVDEAGMKLLKPIVCIIDSKVLTEVTAAVQKLSGLEVEVAK